MIELVIKSSLILALTTCCSVIFRRQSAAVRHTIWKTGLIFALAVPLSSTLQSLLNVNSHINVELGPPPALSQATIVISPVSTKRLSLADIASYVWIAGVGIGFLWLIAGASRLAWITFHAEPMNSERWRAQAVDVSRALRLRRPFLLLRCDRVTTMGAWGIFRAHVLLPPDAEAWADERIRIVLIHELSHIKRNDWLIQFVAEIARVFYWFNLFLWLTCSRLRRESEYACDDVVLRLGIDGQNYAGHLLELARTAKGTGASWSGVLAMAQPRHLERRFLAMLNPSLNHRPLSPTAMVIIAIAAACLLLPVVSTSMAIQVARPLPPSLSGTVFDPSGAVIPGAAIVVTNLQTNVAQSTSSDAAGDYSFSQLAPGDYSLKADLPGFATARIGKLLISGGEAAKQNVSLIVGNVSERVIVKGPGPPKPPALLPPGTPRRIRVGGSVGAMRLINSVRPVYPPSALNAGIEGTVSLQAIVGADGRVQAVRVLSSIDPDLTAAAVEAFKQWRYSPTLLNGVPVETLTNIDIEFKQPQ
jgi:TonB family protein